MKPGWTNLNYYTKYFNVTTEEIKDRLQSGLTADGAFLEKLNGRMDFYGPLWLSISIAVLLFVSSSFGKRAWAHASEKLDLHLLTLGVVELMVYTSFMTLASWGFFRWRGVDGVKVGEMAALSGYSLTPLVPALLISTLPLSIIQWAAFAAAASLSCLFIFRNLWPILQTSPSIRHEQASMFIASLLFVHACFFFALRVAFFKHVHVVPVKP